MKRKESFFAGIYRRVFQLFAQFGPGATTLRVTLHRWRGVKIGKDVWIGYNSIIETSCPELVELQNGVVVGIRNTIIAHFRESQGVVIEEGAFLGPAVTVMPGVKIGRGAVVAAGSTVTNSIAPMTFVQGNPAKPVALVGKVLDRDTTIKKFLMNLKPIK